MKGSDISMPLYYQIVTDIKEKIERREYVPGDKLLTENALSEQYGVSRVTVRNALNALTELGVVERQPYKGYFVAKQKRDKSSRNEHKSLSLYDDLIEAGYEPGSRIISMTTEKCGVHLGGVFGCDPEESVIVLKRVRLASQVPFAEEVNYLPARIFDGINPWELEKRSLIDVMEKDFGVSISYAKQTLRAKRPTKEQKEVLNLKNNEPQLSIHSRLYDKEGNVLKYAKVFFRTDIMEYSFTWML